MSSLSLGIVGLPNVGKSTLFNALLKSEQALAANYPFATIDPNVGIVQVPDPRLEVLARLVQPEKVVPAVVEFWDIAGIVKGASTGEGLGNQFLSNIRQTSALILVTRCFAGETIHVHGKVDPIYDLETVLLELILADLETTAKGIERFKRAAKGGDTTAQACLDFAERIYACLEAEQPANSLLPTADGDHLALRELQLLTSKPFLVVANIDESQLASASLYADYGFAKFVTPERFVPICAQVEAELSSLPDEERLEFMESYGMKDSGMDRLAQAAYTLLNLRTFFTAGPKEAKAWTITAGMTAPLAAGVIHTDFIKGFIRAETIAYADYAKYGGETGAKEAGRLRLEGKEYVVEDGDVMHFRING